VKSSQSRDDPTLEALVQILQTLSLLLLRFHWLRFSRCATSAQIGQKAGSITGKSLTVELVTTCRLADTGKEGRTLTTPRSGAKRTCSTSSPYISASSFSSPYFRSQAVLKACRQKRRHSYQQSLKSSREEPSPPPEVPASNRKWHYFTSGNVTFADH
jgi:hypothetical protein